MTQIPQTNLELSPIGNCQVTGLIDETGEMVGVVETDGGITQLRRGGRGEKRGEANRRRRRQRWRADSARRGGPSGRRGGC